MNNTTSIGQEAKTARKTAISAAWREKNRAHWNQYMVEYRAKHPNKMIASNFRVRVSEVIRWAACRRPGPGMSNQKLKDLTGLSCSEFIFNIKEKLQDGMTFENYGKSVGQWSIDHIKACSEYNLQDPAQLKECFHHSNLRPIWHSQNSKKARKERDALAAKAAQETTCIPTEPATQ